MIRRLRRQHGTSGGSCQLGTQTGSRTRRLWTTSSSATKSMCCTSSRASYTAPQRPCACAHLGRSLSSLTCRACSSAGLHPLHPCSPRSRHCLTRTGSIPRLARRHLTRECSCRCAQRAPLLPSVQHLVHTRRWLTPSRQNPLPAPRTPSAAERPFARAPQPCETRLAPPQQRAAALAVGHRTTTDSRSAQPPLTHWD